MLMVTRVGHGRHVGLKEDMEGSERCSRRDLLLEMGFQF